ncbi:MAG: hypothetical protein ACI9UU_000636, partial [Candidatus Azotimanducaceae bacterium]
MNRLICTLLYLACLGTLLPWSNHSHADDWAYTLRPGDELWSVAKQYCGSARLAGRIAEYNNLSDPAKVRAGTRISIPTQWLVFEPTSAVLKEMSGTVQYLVDSATLTQSSPAKIGQLIDMGGSLITIEGSAMVEFADGSVIILQPNSRILFNKLTAFGPAGMVDTHLRFAYGQGTTKVQPQNRGDRFRIETPEGVAAVRGTEFRVSFDPDKKKATTETLTGAVAFIAPTTSVEVPAGFGVAASQDGVTKETLLVAPNVEVQESYSAGDFLNWQKVTDADTYVVTWAQTKTPNITAELTRHNDNQAEIQLPPGEYIAQVRGVSSQGIAGYDASAQIQILASPPSPSEAPKISPGPANLAWTDATEETNYTVEITNRNTLRSEQVSTHRMTLDLSDAGEYNWRVRTTDSAWSTSQSITVLPVAPK